MTPIDKAIKALTEIVSECRNQGYPNEIVAERMIDRIEETAMICLSDLSSIRLEDGDVEWLTDVLNEIDDFKGMTQAEVNRTGRLLSFLGHRGEG